MAYTTINKHTDYFNTKLYTGNGSTTQSITGVGFKPDFLWIKDRGDVSDHQLSDIVRGKSGSLYYQIQTNGTGSQVVQPDNDGVHSLDSDGFTVGYTNSTAWNKNSSTYASWNWLAGGSQGSSNTDGSINTTYTSVNTTAGFSISTYTGTGSAATIGHGLGAAPKVIIVKRISGTDSWTVGHDSRGWGKYLRLDTTAAEASNTSTWNNTAPTNQVFSVNHNDTNESGVTFVVYCFAEKTGYSKFGSYTGNGNADGAFVYTGFKPAWVLTKQANGGNHWHIHDNKRNAFNVVGKNLKADASNTEEDPAAGENSRDFLSNGFKFRNSDHNNSNGQTYIYMAFGQSLVGSNNVPCTAR